MNAAPSVIELLQIELPDLDWTTDPGRVARLSQDFSWFSPVLKRQLAGKLADIIVKPRSEAEMAAVVGACVRRRIPLVIRGAGTGNYGQTTPMAGGVVIDMTGFKTVQWIRPGAARAQAGVRLGELERQLQASGQEMRCIPSTYKTATLGGLFGGGFGGIGSVNHGPLASPGNVLGIRAMTIEAEPQFVELRGAEALNMHHLWGTNGMVLEVEIATAPAHPWLETLATFADYEQALRYGNALASAPGIAKREVAFFSSAVAAYLTPLSEFLPSGRHVILALVAEPGEPAMQELLARHGGTLAYRKTAAEAQAAHRTLTEFVWNHTTFQALKVDPSLTYLQASFVPGRHIEQILEMEALLGADAEVMMHAEFLRSMDGAMNCSALQLVRFSTEERLAELIAIHRERGVRLNNPHTHIVEEGKAGGDLPAEVIALKKRFDPHGLLNPGKLRDWPAEAA